MGIGYSPLTDRVYIGKQNKEKGVWVGDKRDITNEFLAVSHGYFEENTVREVRTSSKSNLFIDVINDEENINKLIESLSKRILEIKNEENNNP